MTLTAQLAADDRQAADQLAAHAWPKPSHAAIGLLIAALHTQHDRLETVGAAAANGDEIGQDEAGALAAF